MTAVELEFGDPPVVPVVVWVSKARVLEVQAKLSELLASLAVPGTRAGGYHPPFSASHGGPDAWTLDKWTGGDLPAAEWILSVVSDGHRRMLAALLAAGAQGRWTADLRAIGGYDDGTRMSGPFKAIGGRFRRVGRQPMWNGGKVKDPMKGQLLWVGDEAAKAVFSAVLVAGWPELAAEFGVTAPPLGQ
jgi:hypothetical protein